MNKVAELAGALEKELEQLTNNEDCFVGLVALLKQYNFIEDQPLTPDEALNLLGVYLNDYKTIKEENQVLITRNEELRDRVDDLEEQLDT